MVVRGEFAAAGKPLLLDAAMLGSVAYLGFLATALGIGVQSLVQPRIRPTHVALLFATQPLFAAIAGWAVLGDVMGWQQLAGGALIVGGIVAVSLAR
jgi:drug/metabolite transporter (DMT)-like permease